MRTVQSLFTRDVKLAAALVTMGCKPMPAMIERICSNGQPEQCYFHFQESDDCRAYMAAWDQLEDSWSSAQFPNHPLKDPEHRFWYVRAGLRNRERYLDAVKRHSVLHMLNRDGKTYLITKPDHR